ncbi:MAG TPA: carbohydrate ABC transporter permease [Chloroflexota bacterium]|nr:carbohydrate ABC transporter permease [Chloroflexota bacterium]
MASRTIAASPPAARTASRSAAKAQLGRGALYALCLVLSVVFMVPFYWTVVTSFKGPQEIFVFPPTWWPESIRWTNYVQVWQRVPYGTFVVNSAIVTLLDVVGLTLSSALVAYGFARYRFPGRDVLFILTLATIVMPDEVTLVPTFLLFRYINWVDTLLPLIVPHFLGGAFYIFLLRQFFLALPRDLDEAARIDGAGALRILWDVILPLSKPALATAAILAFLQHWNEFLRPLIFLNSTEHFTLPIGIRYFQLLGSQGGEPMIQLLMAASLMMTLPCVVLFFAGQQYFVRGVVMSGLKG